MAKYRSKPVEFEAFQYDGDLMDADGNYYVPVWAVQALLDGTIGFNSIEPEDPPCELFIKNNGGKTIVDVGDYIALGADDNIYHWEKDDFEKLFEEVHGGIICDAEGK